MSVSSRRRFLGLSAAVAGLALLPLPLRAAAANAATAAATAAAPLVWRGSALGADAVIQLHCEDENAGRALIAACVAEVGRLEAVFSLTRPDSALSRLNRVGELSEAPPDLVRLLAESAGFSALTGGAFDATVQPLWTLFAGHFATAGADPAGPPADAVRAALDRVGWRGVVVDPGRVAFARPGMAVTLNGIAQGYITDRVIELLRRHGVDRVLADLGETRSLGRHPDGSPWTVGLEDPRRRGHVVRMLDLENRAVSTSGGYGTIFEPSGRFNHLFEPGSGRSPDPWRSVSVVAPTATMADALSTAFCFMPEQRMGAVLAGRDAIAYLTGADGTQRAVSGG